MADDNRVSEQCRQEGRLYPVSRSTIKAVVFDWGRTLYDPEFGAVFPEAASVVASLAGAYRLGIVSLISHGDYVAQAAERRAILRASGLAPYFTLVLFAPDDKDRLYQRALDHLRVRPEEVVIVDDRVIRGIRWGNRHGAMTIWFRRGRFQDDLPTEDTGAPTHTIETLAALMGLL